MLVSGAAGDDMDNMDAAGAEDAAKYAEPGTGAGAGAGSQAAGQGDAGAGPSAMQGDGPTASEVPLGSQPPPAPKAPRQVHMPGVTGPSASASLTLTQSASQRAQLRGSPMQRELIKRARRLERQQRRQLARQQQQQQEGQQSQEGEGADLKPQVGSQHGISEDGVAETAGGVAVSGGGTPDTDGVTCHGQAPTQPLALQDAGAAGEGASSGPMDVDGPAGASPSTAAAAATAAAAVGAQPADAAADAAAAAAGEAQLGPGGAEGSTGPPEGAAPGPAGAPDFSSLASACVPQAQVVQFVWSVLRSIVPPALLGSKHNRRALRRVVERYVRMRRYEQMSLHEALQGMRVKEMPWLVPGEQEHVQQQQQQDADAVAAARSGGAATGAATTGVEAAPAATAAASATGTQANTRSAAAAAAHPEAPAPGGASTHARPSRSLHEAQQRWLGQWVHWLVMQVVAPLLRNCFYVTESEPYRMQVFYYR